MTTTITLELTEAQCAALLKAFPQTEAKGRHHMAVALKLRQAIRDAERARALLRGEYRLTQGKALPVHDKA